MIQDPSRARTSEPAAPPAATASPPAGVLRIRSPSPSSTVRVAGAFAGVPQPAPKAPDGWHLLPDILYDAVCFTDPEGHVLDTNRRAEELFKRSREEICRLTMPELIDGLTPAVLRAVRVQLDSGHAAIIEGWCARPDGDRIPVEAAITRLTATPPRMCFAVRGIAQRKVSETALRAEHRAMENAACGLTITDLVGHIEYANPAWRAMWGLSAEPPVDGRLISDFWGSDWMPAAWHCLQTGEPWHGTLAAPGADGRAIRASVAPNWNEEDEMIGLVVCQVAADQALPEGTGHAAAKAPGRPMPAKGFWGSFGALGVSDIVQLIDSARMTGRLEFLRAESPTATVHFAEGRLVCADGGGLTGEAAFLAAVRDPGEAFQFTPDVTPPRHDDIRRSLLALMVEEFRGQPGRAK